MRREFDEEMNNMCNLSEGVKEDERINSAKKIYKTCDKKESYDF